MYILILMKKINWQHVKGVILDMDGVVYNGDKSIKSAIKAIKIWRKKNIKICFLTNNSTKNQKEFANKLKSMNLIVDKKSIITSSVCTANYLKENHDPKLKIYIIGSNSLKRTIYKEGFIEDKNNAQIVVVGLDVKCTYQKLHIASKLVRQGAKFIGTNPDKLYPTEKGLNPGAGTIIDFVKIASYNSDCFIVGKPNPFFVNSAIQFLKLKKKNIILIGDQLETDILAANNAKISSVLVNTGVANKNKKIKFSVCVNSLMELPISK